MLNIDILIMWQNKMPGFAILHRPFSIGEGEGGRGFYFYL